MSEAPTSRLPIRTLRPLLQSLRFTNRHRNLALSAFTAGGVTALADLLLAGHSRTLREQVLGLSLLLLGIGIGLLSWRLSIYLLLVYLPVSGLPILATYPNTQLADVAKDLAFVVPAYVGFLLTEPRKQWVFPGLPLIALAALSIIVVLQCFNPGVSRWLVAIIGAKVWLLYLPLLVIGYRLVQSREELQRLFAILLGAATIPVVVGLAEAALLDVFGPIPAACVNLGAAVCLGPSWFTADSSVFSLYGAAAQAATQNYAFFNYGARLIWRIPSTFSFVAQFFSFTASMLVVAYGWWRLSSHRRLGLVPLVFIVMAGLTSGERGAIIMLPLLIMMFVAFDGRLKQIATVGVVAAITLAAAVVALGSKADLITKVFGIGLGELHDTTVVGFAATLKLGWFGHGTGTATGASRLAFETGPALALSVLESWWLRAIYELGLEGFVASIALFSLLLVRGWRAMRSSRDRELRAVAGAMLAFLVWNLLYDLKGSLMNIDPINVYFWLFAGMMLRLGIPFGVKDASPSTANAIDSGSGRPMRAGAQV